MTGKKLLAVLDMPEEEQRQWALVNILRTEKPWKHIDGHPLDYCRKLPFCMKCGKELPPKWYENSETAECTKPDPWYSNEESLAELAFRLRDEACAEPDGSEKYYESLERVYKKQGIQKRCVSFLGWVLYWLSPIVMIIAALLAKEDVKASLFGHKIVRRKERKSFFRRLAESKGSPPIDFEVVLCCEVQK